MKQATLQWLQHEDEWETLDESSKESKELYWAEVPDERPIQPEPLTIRRSLQRLGLPYYVGSYINQPYILSLELNAVIDAELEYEHLQLINAKLMADAYGKETTVP